MGSTGEGRSDGGASGEQGEAAERARVEAALAAWEEGRARQDELARGLAEGDPDAAREATEDAERELIRAARAGRARLRALRGAYEVLAGTLARTLDGLAAAEDQRARQAELGGPHGALPGADAAARERAERLTAAREALTRAREGLEEATEALDPL